jgi:hypothetical protein
MLHALHHVTILPALVTFRACSVRIRASSTAHPRNKPCSRGDHLPSRANRTSRVLCLLFGISIMSQAMTLEPSPVDLDRTMAPSEHNGLGTAYDHYRFDDALSSQTPDTLDASSGPPPPPRTTATTHSQEPFVQPLSHGQPVHTSSRPESVTPGVLPPPPPPQRSSTPLHSPRSTRSQSLAASLGSQSPIRRKPLSPTASPLAVRFSSKSFHTRSHDLQEQPDSGYYSLDSPDLYDLGPAGGPALAASLPLEPLSEEE